MASNSLNVTNLPEGLDEGMVTQFFSIYGTVAACKIPDPNETGKTTCIVTFANAEEAKKIMETLNNTVPAGLSDPLSIKFASPGGRSPAAAATASGGYGAYKGGGGGTIRANPWGGNDAGKGASWSAAAQGGGGEPPESENVYVQGLPSGTTEESAMSTFAEFGKVVQIKVLEKPNMPVCALIRFADLEAAKLVKEILNGAQPEGFPGPLKVKFANQKTQTQTAGGGCNSWGAQGGWGDNAWATQFASWDQAGKGGWGAAAAGKGAAAWGAAATGAAAWGAAATGKGKSSIKCDTLVDLVFQSGYLPGGANYRNDDASVYIAGLPLDADQGQLYRMFSPFGAIHSCYVKTPDAGSKYTYAFINYLDGESAKAAVVAYNGMEMPTGDCLKANIKTAGKGGN